MTNFTGFDPIVAKNIQKHGVKSESKFCFIKYPLLYIRGQGVKSKVWKFVTNFGNRLNMTRIDVGVFYPFSFFA